MPWYGWLLLAIAIGIALTAITLRTLRATRRGRRFLALSTRAKLDFGRELLRQPNVPLLDKVALGLLVGYLALPFDLIPDFIPVIGQLDDLLIVSVALLILVRTIPPDVWAAAMAHAEHEEPLRRTRDAATIEAANVDPTPRPPPS